MCGLGFLECYVILRICDSPQWNVPMECPSPYLLIVKEPQKNANNNGRNFSGIFVLTMVLLSAKTKGNSVLELNK